MSAANKYESNPQNDDIGKCATKCYIMMCVINFHNFNYHNAYDF